jgi:hypothetical protein
MRSPNGHAQDNDTVKTHVSNVMQASEPAHDEIAKRAYLIYEQAGCLPGQCDQNWQQAKNELKGLSHV